MSYDPIYDAVAQKMQSRWFALSGSSFDGMEVLHRKQAELDKLKKWADTISDEPVKKAYQRYFDVVQYTITRSIDGRIREQKAKELAPTIPDAP